MKGEWPGLTDTDSGDLRVVNDYRAVLSEVLSSTVFRAFDTSSASWLGVTRAVARTGARFGLRAGWGTGGTVRTVGAARAARSE